MSVAGICGIGAPAYWQYLFTVMPGYWHAFYMLVKFYLLATSM